MFASGSPFKNVDLGMFLDKEDENYRAKKKLNMSLLSDLFLTTGNGKVGHVNQANNMFLFPG